MASTKAVYVLVPLPLERQIQDLLTSHRVEEALVLTEGAQRNIPKDKFQVPSDHNLHSRHPIGITSSLCIMSSAAISCLSLNRDKTFYTLNICFRKAHETTVTTLQFRNADANDTECVFLPGSVQSLSLHGVLPLGCIQNRKKNAGEISVGRKE